MHELSTILLVEDNADDAELIAYAFDKAGIVNPLVTVSDGDAAIAYIEGTGPYADMLAQRFRMAMARLNLHGTNAGTQPLDCARFAVPDAPARRPRREPEAQLALL